MSAKIFYIILPLFIFTACHTKINEEEKNKSQTMTDSISFKSGYSKVNGLDMYYEIYGEGKPLVLIHGGGSTIQSSFGKMIPLLAKARKIVAMDLQAHGRTSDRESPESFEQDADDVATLLQNLHIERAEFFGFSNGANTTMRIAMRHPEMVDKIIVGSGFYKRDGMIPHFWEGMEHATIDNMPQQLKDEYLRVKPDPQGLQNMFNKDAARMRSFKDWPDDDLRSIKAPALIISGDQDVMTPEHAVQMWRLIPHAQLAILPGGHGKYLGEMETLTQTSADSIYIVPMLEEFLDEKK
jgi:pimeloyl-ACP methyl ester carboxylesterase